VENLRRHSWRAVRRLSALLIIDALCFLVARLIARTVGDAAFGYSASFLVPRTAGIEVEEVGLAVALLVGTAVSGTYGRGDAHRHVGRLCLAAAIASALPLWSHIWTQPSLDALRTYLLAFGPLFCALVALRTAFDAVAQRWSQRAAAGTLGRAVLVGTAGDCLTRRNGALLDGRGGFEVLGFIDVAESAHATALGRVADLERVLVERRADTVVLCGLPTPGTMKRVLRAAAIAECTVFASTPQLEQPSIRPNVVMRAGKPLLELRPVALRAERLWLKRAIDIIGAAVLLVVLAPVLAIVAAMVALDSPGPVIFAQRRLGRFGRPMRCYKFRSMHVDAEARLLSDPMLFRRYVEHDYKLPASMDTRITRAGRFLRRTSLDELPQLWNVLKGEMSLVGPRPIVPDEIHHYKSDGRLLLSLKPGITGAWQVSGRSAVAYPERAAVELEYVEGWNLRRDVAILLRTLPAVLERRGAY
jgi:exopolysaccharide production protein ExoY